LTFGGVVVGSWNAIRVVSVAAPNSEIAVQEPSSQNPKPSTMAGELSHRQRFAEDVLRALGFIKDRSA
jgi:hypothetical protein